MHVNFGLSSYQEKGKNHLSSEKKSFKSLRFDLSAEKDII